jgi:hypothetical protein
MPAELEVLRALSAGQIEDTAATTSLHEFPKPSASSRSATDAAQSQQVQVPTVFFYEKQRWEYRVLSKNAAEQSTVTEDELNALRQNGWELVGLVSSPSSVQPYVKRAR